MNGGSRKSKKSRHENLLSTNYVQETLIKSALVVVAVATSCLGAWRAYGVYGNADKSQVDNITFRKENEKRKKTTN